MNVFLYLLIMDTACCLCKYLVCCCWCARVCFISTILMLTSMAYFLALWIINACSLDSFCNPSPSTLAESLLAPLPYTNFSVWTKPVIGSYLRFNFITQQCNCNCTIYKPLNIRVIWGLLLELVVLEVGLQHVLHCHDVQDHHLLEASKTPTHMVILQEDSLVSPCFISEIALDDEI